MNRLMAKPAPIMMRRIIAGRDSGTAWSSTAQPTTTISAAPAPVTAANGAKSAAPASVQRTASGSGSSGRTRKAHTTNPAASIKGNPMAKRSALASTESLNFPMIQRYPGWTWRDPRTCAQVRRPMPAPQRAHLTRLAAKGVP